MPEKDWRYYAGPHASKAITNLGDLARALAGTVGPQADVVGMYEDVGQIVPSLKRGDYGQAMGSALMAGAAVPMMALPGTVSQVKAASKLPMDEASRMAKEMGQELQPKSITRKGGSAVTPEDVASIMDTNRWFEYGPKLRKGTKLYRGVSDTSGSHSAQYGRGLYTTTDKAQAKEFGKILEMSSKDIPSNPLRFSDEMAYKNWEENARNTLGYKRASEFDIEHGLPEEWIRKINPDVDGIQIGDGSAGTYFVKW